MRFDSNRGRGSIQIGPNLLLSEGYSEVSEVLVLSLLSSEVESEVVSPGLLSLQLLLLSVQHLHGLIDGVSEGVKCLNLLLLNLPGLGLGLGEVTLQLGDTLFLSWRK